MKFQMIQMLRFLGISNVIFARPTDSKKNCSHACWFWVLEMVILFKLLIIYTAKSIVIYSRVKRIIKAYLWQKRFVLIL